MAIAQVFGNRALSCRCVMEMQYTFAEEIFMKIGWTKVLVAACAMTSVAAVAQGDPPRLFDAATAVQRAPGTKVRIDLIGDSTQTNNAGYGRGFCANLTSAVDCVNMAKGGASTKTFREQGLWQQSLETKPDYMLIQFGHNDEETADH